MHGFGIACIKEIPYREDLSAGFNGFADLHRHMKADACGDTGRQTKYNSVIFSKDQAEVSKRCAHVNDMRIRCHFESQFFSVFIDQRKIS